MLDKNQQEVVDHTGNALILAGPGAGKTRVVAEKNLQLLSEGWMSSEILNLTFSKSAATELTKRLSEYLPVHTFHSFALGTLPYPRRHVLPTRRTGWDVRREFFCSIVGYSREDYESKSDIRWGIEAAISEIDRYKSRLDAELPRRLQSTYKLYQRFLEEDNYIDFNDMLRLSLRQLEKKHPHYTWVLVDEGHDTSMLQYEILRRLETENLWMIFSPHQMIYRWNDADERNMERFRNDYTPKEFFLRNNYRSGKPIVSTLETLYEDSLVPLGPDGIIEVMSNYSPASNWPSMERKAEELYSEFPDSKVLARTNSQLQFYRNRLIPCDTLHSSKGTEYETVIIVGCDSSTLPHKLSRDKEEEKNLFYVGVSRAKKNLFLLYEGNPSPFLRRIKNGHS